MKTGTTRSRRARPGRSRSRPGPCRPRAVGGKFARSSFHASRSPRRSPGRPCRAQVRRVFSVISVITCCHFLPSAAEIQVKWMRSSVDAQRVQQFAEEHPAPPGVVVAGRVVAIARMAAGDEHRVGPHLERLDDQVEIDAPGAGQADDPHVGRILQPVRAGQVGAEVRTPVADVGDDLRLEAVRRSLIPGSPPSRRSAVR